MKPTYGTPRPVMMEDERGRLIRIHAPGGISEVTAKADAKRRRKALKLAKDTSK